MPESQKDLITTRNCLRPPFPVIIAEQGQHGATHAWTEIYVPGRGWLGFDPTNNKPVGSEHVTVAVAREHEKASPFSGSWEGEPDAFDRMEVSVQVVAT